MVQNNTLNRKFLTVVISLSGVYKLPTCSSPQEYCEGTFPYCEHSFNVIKEFYEGIQLPAKFAIYGDRSNIPQFVSHHDANY